MMSNDVVDPDCEAFDRRLFERDLRESLYRRIIKERDSGVIIKFGRGSFYAGYGGLSARQYEHGMPKSPFKKRILSLEKHLKSLRKNEPVSINYNSYIPFYGCTTSEEYDRKDMKRLAEMYKGRVVFKGDFITELDNCTCFYDLILDLSIPKFDAFDAAFNVLRERFDKYRFRRQ